MKAIMMVSLIFMVGGTAMAEESSMASKSATCKHADGYGDYSSTAGDLNTARSQSTSACFNHKVDMFEASSKRLPSADEADLLMDSCVNICG